MAVPVGGTQALQSARVPSILCPRPPRCVSLLAGLWEFRALLFGGVLNHSLHSDACLSACLANCGICYIIDRTICFRNAPIGKVFASIHSVHGCSWSSRYAQGILSERHTLRGSCQKAVTSKPSTLWLPEAFTIPRSLLPPGSHCGGTPSLVSGPLKPPS